MDSENQLPVTMLRIALAQKKSGEVSVEREYQNTRIDTNLMARSLIILRNRRIDTAHIVCFLSNSRMQKLALRYRADREAYNGDVFMSIEVPLGTVGTLLSEMADGYIGCAAGRSIRHRRPVQTATPSRGKPPPSNRRPIGRREANRC